MRGRFTNICMALLNLLLGALIIVYALNVPNDMTELTIQEYDVVSTLRILSWVIFAIVTILNIIHFFLDNRNPARKTGYFIAVLAIRVCFLPKLFLGNSKHFIFTNNFLFIS